MSALGEAALVLAERGIHVFPLHARAKTPITKRGHLDATTDLEVVKAWWEGYSDANIGVATGPRSGFWVLDIDGEDGEASLAEVERRMGALPATSEVITGGGGRHLYFRLADFDGAVSIRCSAGKLGKGLDVRGHGGYVVSPPSIHPNGRAYAWSVDSLGDPVDAPVWLLALLTPSPEALDERRPVEHWLRILNQGADEGTRNATAASLAGHLLRRHVDARLVLDIVLMWNERNRPPLAREEILTVVKSIADLELKRRAAR